jgi:hypothetical protein
MAFQLKENLNNSRHHLPNEPTQEKGHHEAGSGSRTIKKECRAPQRLIAATLPFESRPIHHLWAMS